MNRRGLGDLTNFVFLVSIGLILLLGMIVFYNGFLTNYSSPNAELSEVENASNYTFFRVESLMVNVSSGLEQSAPIQDQSIFTVLFNGAFGAVKSLFGLLGIFTDLFGILFGFVLTIVPLGWLTPILTGLISVFIGFTMLKIILGRDI